MDGPVTVNSTVKPQKTKDAILKNRVLHLVGRPGLEPGTR